MPKSNANLALKGLDEMFSAEESRQEQKREQVQQIPIEELFPFKEHPFKVLDDEAMQRTVESVAQYGVLAPLIARPRPEGGYEIISGHRRQHAAELAGLDTLPVIVREMTDDAAVILMVDSNLQRENILPSERAFAYKMKLEALKNQGARSDLTSPQVAAKFRSDDAVAKDQGIEQIPTVHMGVAATQMERRGIVTDKGNQNREIREQNRLLKEVKRRIAALTAWIKEKTAQTKENPFPSVPILSERSEQPPTLLELLNRAYTEAAKPQSRYGKIQDLKLYAKAFNFLQSRNITTLVQLQEVVSDMKKQYWTTNGEIKQTEKLLHERKELIDQAEKYLEHRPTYKVYMQTKPKKQEDFFESNRAALTLYQSAERYLKEHLGEDKVLKPKAWKAEIADLIQKKSRLYSSLQTLRAEVQEAEAVKKCVEQAVQPEQTKEKTQNKRRDMEL